MHTAENGAPISSLPSFLLPTPSSDSSFLIETIWITNDETTKTNEKLSKDLMKSTVEYYRSELSMILTCHGIDLAGCSYRLQQLWLDFKNYVWVTWSLSCIWFLSLMNHFPYFHQVMVNFCIFFIAVQYWVGETFTPWKMVIYLLI